jgi:hypothetical protein
VTQGSGAEEARQSAWLLVRNVGTPQHGGDQIGSSEHKRDRDQALGLLHSNTLPEVGRGPSDSQSTGIWVVTPYCQCAILGYLCVCKFESACIYPVGMTLFSLNDIITSLKSYLLNKSEGNKPYSHQSPFLTVLRDRSP